jgi:hypothetical protein
MRAHSFVPKLVAFGIIGFALGACQAIAGIEERKLDPKAPGARNDSKQCKDYCSTVMEACTGTNSVYTKVELCLAVCAELDPGDSTEPVGNNVACRAKQAADALREPEDHCKNAGPGGNGQCGSDCQAYCQLAPIFCPENVVNYPTEKSCLTACSGLPQQDSFDTDRDHGGDTVECRLVHLSSAAELPLQHCAHATIPPAKDWCRGEPADSPTCKDYCLIEMVACQGELAQYESPEQCEKVCGALELGTNEDQTGNTVGCRRYHAFSSTTAPETHCFHSGPTGDGHCGHDKVDDGITGNCEAYCAIVASACPTEFDASLGDAEACMAACVQLPEAPADSKYTLDAAEESKGLSCRVLYAARAFEDKAACASALGGDRCEP